MNTLQIHHIKRPPRKQDYPEFSDVLKPHHKLAGFRLRKVNATTLALVNPWGQTVGRFNLNYLSKHEIWEAADRDIVYGYRCHGRN